MIISYFWVYFALSFLFFWLFFCVAVATWANKLGHSPTDFFLLSFALSPLVAAIILLLQGEDEVKVRERTLSSGTRRACPTCKELIFIDALKCRYCGTSLLASTGLASTGEVFLRSSMLLCKGCGSVNSADNSLCTDCGQPL
jgi:RNA polymerase subunit RPABC4/transcription elongation factor Spt4